MKKESDFNAAEWIERHAGLDRGEVEKLQPVLWFVLLWNRFEVELCNRKASMKTIVSGLSCLTTSNKIIWGDFEEIWNSLKDYLTALTYSNDLHFFLLSDTVKTTAQETEYVEKLKQTLDAKGPIQATPCLEGMLFVAYRIRNNLFHGEKGITSLPKQLELFRILNRLIAKLLDVAEAP